MVDEGIRRGGGKPSIEPVGIWERANILMSADIVTFVTVDAQRGQTDKARRSANPDKPRRVQMNRVGELIKGMSIGGQTVQTPHAFLPSLVPVSN